MTDREEISQCHPRSPTPPSNICCKAAGLTLTDAEKADLKTIHDGLAAMKARVRQKRGHMAELAHTYGFAPEDLT